MTGGFLKKAFYPSYSLETLRGSPHPQARILVESGGDCDRNVFPSMSWRRQGRRHEILKIEDKALEQIGE